MIFDGILIPTDKAVCKEVKDGIYTPSKLTNWLRNRGYNVDLGYTAKNKELALIMYVN